MRYRQPKITLYAILTSIFLPLLLPAQMVPEFYGARAAAMGNASATVGDVWAVQNNIGALASLENPTVAFGYNTRFNLQELTTIGAVFAYPLTTGVAGVSVSRFGMGAYHVQSVGIGYSHRIEYISLGIKLSYLQQSVKGFESVGNLVLEAGGKVALLPKLHFAAHAYNLTQSTFSGSEESEIVPVLLKAGLTYLPANHIQLHLQTFKDVAYPARLSVGLDYRIIKALSLRAGIVTAPVVASFGLGFRPGQFSFDYAFRHHNIVGAAHHLSVGYAFNQQDSP